MKPKQYNSIINGVKASGFPNVPVDYGYRDSTNFWYTKFRKPIPEKIQAKEGDVKSVVYAASRIDPNVKFTDEACAKLTKIPRVFLKQHLLKWLTLQKKKVLVLLVKRNWKLLTINAEKKKRNKINILLC